MKQTKKHVDWCLKKAEKELEKSNKHRGLVKIKPNVNLAREHIDKAEHYLKATDLLKEKGFSDISASTVFYAIYQSLLAISVKFGYESKNQTCTFALIRNLVEEKKIDFDENLIRKISSLDDSVYSVVEIRETYQYGTKLSMEYELYQQTMNLAIKVISRTKEIIEY
ncbi:HEPN domain-containing protein [archaeon]|jgi:uncharacterized protein (UPF0332 family)|nr:HEPN domain-containing protein [archaeon]MBT4350910.1 HEPN domain-containing protein [archaeon]MBT4646958.1 HEPN domain-containing protein [archaeon]MBT6821676.1 HEPN domain-containing protein [archaeon]MBT7392207.1 HEPN domain-containing protein [archaeon]